MSAHINSYDTKVKIRTVVADIKNKDAMNMVFKDFQPEVVYHAAAYKHVPLMENNPSQAILTNVEGTKNIADLSCQYKVKNFTI